MKVFAALVLAFGMVSRSHHQVPTANLCYRCDGGPECDNPTKEEHTASCLDPNMACFKAGVAGAMKRGCYSERKARCIEWMLNDEYGPNLKLKCYNAIVHNRTGLTGKILRCLKKSGLPTELPAAEGTFCACNDEMYCNDGPAELHDYANGTTEQPGQGLKCYSCEGLDRDCSHGKYCVEGEYCAEATTFKGKVTKWCLPKREAECMKDSKVTSPNFMYIGKDGFCWDSKSREETVDIWNKVENCANSPRAMSPARLGKRILDHFEKMCICNDKDLCNGNLIPAGQGTSNSNSKLIFGILAIAAIYNYMR